MRLLNRRHAGALLARTLGAYAERDDVVVLALPRGGVPVAYEVALRLHAPLDVFVVRKLGVPGHDELAMGALASGDVMVKNDDVIAMLGVTHDELDAVAAHERAEIARRERAYRGDAPPLALADRTVILVDDGLATGATMKAAAIAIASVGPRRLVAAVPVGPAETCAEVRALVDELAVLMMPRPFYAVGAFYDDFRQTSDDEVRMLLADARAHVRAEPPSA